MVTLFVFTFSRYEYFISRAFSTGSVPAIISSFTAVIT